LSYLKYLQDARLTRNLYRDATGITAMQKPDKIFLENTNLMFLFARNQNADRGNIRETFLVNQVGYEHRLEFPLSGDFWVDRKYLIEVGGKNKTAKQLRAAGDTGYIAADDIEYGHHHTIPLWLFGFLY
jgi:predicted AAA+ superfamily ATPase